MKFEPGKTIDTDTPKIEVDGTLAVGVHRFRLVVENDRGQRSRPAEISISVVRQEPASPTSDRTPRPARKSIIRRRNPSRPPR